MSGLCLQRLCKTFVEGFASFRTFAPRLEVANFVTFCSPYQAFFQQCLTGDVAKLARADLST